MKTTYKVWLYIEQLDDPDTENEKYQDIGMPTQLAHTSSLQDATNFVDAIEDFLGSLKRCSSIDD